MKYNNLNNYIIGNKQYLTYLFQKYGSKEDYNQFILDKKYNEHLLPYVYTYTLLSKKEKSCFDIFYMNYIEKSGIIETPIDGDIVDIFEFASTDIVYTVTLIIAAQYYFL
jgi:hypothetical protein